MKRTIRYGTFETASSAIHSMVISKDGMRPSELKPNRRTGKISVPLTYLGREHVVYSTQLEKLTFLLTYLWCCCHWRDYDSYWQTDKIEDDYRFRYINEAIKDYCGYEIEIKLPKTKKGMDEIGADHQIINEAESYSELPYVNVYNEKSIQEFIFNSYIAVETDCD